MTDGLKYGLIFFGLLVVWSTAMCGLVGLSVWLFNVVGSPVNPVLHAMVGCLKLLPASFGIGGFAGGPLLWAEFGWIKM